MTTHHLSSDALHAVCRDHGSGTPTWQEFLEVRQGAIRDLTQGRVTISGGVAQIPDTYLLITVLARVLQKPLRICTHCPRQLAVAFVREAGFNSFIPSGIMVCGDDNALSKDSPQYWESVIPLGASSAWIGLDDTADGAAWMLRVARLGLVIVRPSSGEYSEPLAALKQEYGDRLFVVREFGELFEGG